MEISKGGESIGNFPMFPNEKKEEVDEMYESKVVIEKTQMRKICNRIEEEVDRVFVIDRDEAERKRN